jgi:hypothetical protein
LNKDWLGLKSIPKEVLEPIAAGVLRNKEI